MGIQDRDYYREKHKKKVENDNSHGSNQAPTPYKGKTGKQQFRYLIPVILSIMAIVYSADVLVKLKQALKKQPQVVYVPDTSHKPIREKTSITASQLRQPHSKIRSEGVIIKADNQGHFRGTVLTNNVPMPFLIDTGATKTVIPGKFAASASLPYGRHILANTAGGKISQRETTIDVLKIGNIVIRNLDAHINNHLLHEVLIGMNTLRYFQMTQNHSVLTLIPNKTSTAQIQNVHKPGFSSVASDQYSRKKTIIKKTVTCDKNNVCITKYSDH